MAGALVLGAAGMAVTAIDLGSFFVGLLGDMKFNPQTQTTVTITIGGAPNSDGGVPDVTVSGPYEYRLAEHYDSKGHLKGSASASFVMNNIAGFDTHAQVYHPHYLTLAARDDAIYVTAVAASGNGAQYIWTGDMGHYCGAARNGTKASTQSGARTRL